MLKKSILWLLVIFLAVNIDFILSFVIAYIFKKHEYLNQSFLYYIRAFCYGTGLISLIFIGSFAILYLFFYFAFEKRKFFNFYKKWGVANINVYFYVQFYGCLCFCFCYKCFRFRKLTKDRCKYLANYISNY